MKVSGERFSIFTPKIHRPIIGGGGPVADAAWDFKKGQPVSMADFYFEG